MKKLILGSVMMATGLVGIAILCAGAMCSQFTVNGSNNFIDIWRLFGVTPVAVGCAVLAVCGFVLAVVGAFIKTKE